MNRDQPYHEAALVQELAKGSIDAFKALYLHYYDPLVAQTRQLTKDFEAASDIAQNVFLKLWERREQFGHYAAIGGWLFVSSHHEALNYLKKLVRQRNREAAAQQLFETTSTPDTSLQEAQFQLIETAIDQLPSQARRVFQLVKFEGLTYEQAAEALSISKNTVKTHLLKAVSFIRDYVNQYSNHPPTLTTALVLAYLMQQP